MREADVYPGDGVTGWGKNGKNKDGKSSVKSRKIQPLLRLEDGNGYLYN